MTPVRSAGELEEDDTPVTESGGTPAPRRYAVRERRPPQRYSS